MFGNLIHPCDNTILIGDHNCKEGHWEQGEITEVRGSKLLYTVMEIFMIQGTDEDTRLSGGDTSAGLRNNQ